MNRDRCSATFMLPQQSPGTLDTEPLEQFMFCPECECPAMIQYWEWAELNEDQLTCPNCHEDVQIGTWIAGRPEAVKTQKCLFCD